MGSQFSRVTLLATVVSIVLAGSPCAASIELVQEHSFSLPTTDAIRGITFGDVDHDGIPEVLYRTDHGYRLYSIVADSVIFSQTYSADTFVNYVMLGDVNRDRATDIVIGRAAIVPGVSVSFELTAFSGAAGYSETGSFQYDPGGGAPNPTDGRIYFARAVDINGDRTDELLFSFDQRWVSNDLTEEQSVGFTRLYYSFPDSAMWDKSSGLARIVSFVDASDSTRFLVEPLAYWGTSHQGWGSSNKIGTTSLLTGDGNLRLLADYRPFPSTDPWCMYPDFRSIATVPECAGRIRGLENSVEFLVFVAASWGCWPELIQGHFEFQLRRFNSNGSSDIIWSREAWARPLAYNPLHPGHFLSFGDPIYDVFDPVMRVRLYRGSDGSEIARSAPVSGGGRWWETNFPDNLPRLIARQDNHMTVYRLDISTAVDSDDSETTLPERFALGRPFPNPFNASVVIPLSLPRRATVSIDLFNMLGQKVAQVFDGSLDAGERRVRWDAGGYPSAVYIVRAVSGDQTQTAKIVLLK